MAKELSEKKKQMILAGIVCFTVLYVDLNYILKSQIKNLQDVTFKLNNVRSDVYQYQRHFSKLKNMQEELSALKEKNKRLNSMVFSEADIASFQSGFQESGNLGRFGVLAQFMKFKLLNGLFHLERRQKTASRSYFLDHKFAQRLDAGDHVCGQRGFGIDIAERGGDEKKFSECSAFRAFLFDNM